MNESPRIIPIYSSKGEPGAFLVYPMLYNLEGEWIGWVTPDKDVYSTLGIYVGYLGKEPRILRKRTYDFTTPPRPIPPRPASLIPPPTIPLAPMMSELTYETLDVLLEWPELLHTTDTGELREDMD